METCQWLSNEKQNFIKWPTNYTEVSEKFSNKGPRRFPNVLGAVDGVDINILAPYEDKISYFNRKGNYSIKCQAICDSEKLFTDVLVGYPGACHDANMWKASSIYKTLICPESTIPGEYHVLGDSAYPINTFIMKPYRDNGHLTRKQINFNRILSSTRVKIEQAFGLLIGKFRRLKYLHMSDLVGMKYVIMAAFVLHNIIILNENDVHEDDDYDYQAEIVDVNDNFNIQTERNPEADRKRDSLADILFYGN